MSGKNTSQSINDIAFEPYMSAMIDEAPELFYYTQLHLNNVWTVALEWAQKKNDTDTISNESKVNSASLLNDTFVLTFIAMVDSEKKRFQSCVAELARLAMEAGHKCWEDIFSDLDEQHHHLKPTIREIFSSFLVNGTEKYAREAAHEAIGRRSHIILTSKTGKTRALV